MLEVSIKTPKEILFCKPTGLYIMHTKWGLVVRGHLAPLCMFIVASKTNFMFFKHQVVVVYILTSVLSTSQQRCHWLSRCLCKHFSIWRMTQNLVKNIIGIVASSYQVNLAIEIPNITRKLHKFARFHFSTLDVCNACLDIGHFVGKLFWLARYFSIREGLELIGTCQEKTVWN